MRFSPIVLLVLIFISKEILVFNEEILVLFAFGVFIFLVARFGSSMIIESLEERAIKINEEFTFYKELQQKTFLHLIDYHKKQMSLVEEVKEIFNFAKSECHLLIQSFHLSLYNTLHNSLEEKLKRILSGQVKRNNSLQAQICGDLKAYIVNKYIDNNGNLKAGKKKYLRRSLKNFLEVSLKK
uniref:ATP synthase F0 subunit 4 n=1 Tax=Proteomonas sulcata TaxID=77928 RepID=A0A2P1G894_9CRYP|nr:ATP synthase F0 subunit 4 [Proteomonas sulcata]AVM81181.1 ATP synthase F0 subunit 4 [Proteomonas sulcata]